MPGSEDDGYEIREMTKEELYKMLSDIEKKKKINELLNDAAICVVLYPDDSSIAINIIKVLKLMNSTE